MANAIGYTTLSVISGVRVGFGFRPVIHLGLVLLKLKRCANGTHTRPVPDMPGSQYCVQMHRQFWLRLSLPFTLQTLVGIFVLHLSKKIAFSLL